MEYVGLLRFFLITTALFFIGFSTPSLVCAEEFTIEVSASTQIDSSLQTPEEVQQQLREMLKRANETFEIEPQTQHLLLRFFAKVINNFRLGQLTQNATRLIFSSESGANIGTLFLSTHLTEMAISGVGAITLWAIGASTSAVAGTSLFFATDILCYTAHGIYLFSRTARDSWQKFRISVLKPGYKKIIQSEFVQRLLQKYFHETAAFERMLTTFRENTDARFRFLANMPNHESPERADRPIKVELIRDSIPMITMHMTAYHQGAYQNDSLALKLLEVHKTAHLAITPAELDLFLTHFGWNISEAVGRVMKSLPDVEAMRNLRHLFHVLDVFEDPQKFSVVFSGTAVNLNPLRRRYSRAERLEMNRLLHLDCQSLFLTW